MGDIGTGVPISVGVSLEEDSPRGGLGGISADGKGAREVRKLKDGLGEK